MNPHVLNEITAWVYGRRVEQLAAMLRLLRGAVAARYGVWL